MVINFAISISPFLEEFSDTRLPLYSFSQTAVREPCSHGSTDHCLILIVLLQLSVLLHVFQEFHKLYSLKRCYDNFPARKLGLDIAL